MKRISILTALLLTLTLKAGEPPRVPNLKELTRMSNLIVLAEVTAIRVLVPELSRNHEPAPDVLGAGEKFSFGLKVVEVLENRMGPLNSIVIDDGVVVMGGGSGDGVEKTKQKFMGKRLIFFLVDDIHASGTWRHFAAYGIEHMTCDFSRLDEVKKLIKGFSDVSAAGN